MKIPTTRLGLLRQLKEEYSFLVTLRCHSLAIAQYRQASPCCEFYLAEANRLDEQEQRQCNRIQSLLSYGVGWLTFSEAYAWHPLNCDLVIS